MFGGFLPTPREASFMFDFVVIAMVAVVPVLAWSIYLVRYQKNYQLHKWVQLALGGILLVAVLLFETDIRMDSTWWDRAMLSPFYQNGLLSPFLYYIHLPIAVATTFLWIVTIWGAMKNFPQNARPNAYSRIHRWLGRLAALGMFSTAVTGWIFYWMAFVATA